MDFIAKHKSTIIGIASAVLSILVMLGVIDLEKQTAIVEGVEILLDSSDSLLNEAAGLWTALLALLGLVSKDGE